MSESRSAPILGPGRGRPISNRFETVELQGPKYYHYELPRLEVFKDTGSRTTTRLGPGRWPGSPEPKPRDVQLAPSGCGADTFYAVRAERCMTAPRFGPGHGRPMSPQHTDLVPKTDGADALYSMPPVDAYRPRQPRIARWDPALEQRPRTRGLLTHAQYTLPAPEVFMKNTVMPVRLDRSGPRIGSTPRGEGADCLYSIPPVSVVKSTTTNVAHRFGAPVVRHEVGGRSPGPAVRILPATPPSWLEHLSAYKPRPNKPWLQPLGGVPMGGLGASAPTTSSSAGRAGAVSPSPDPGP